MTWMFGGVDYRTSHDYYAAVAREWLSGGGSSSRQFVRETFVDASHEALADEVIEAWEFEPPSSVSGLIKAFADYRKIVAPRRSRMARRPTTRCVGSAPFLTATLSSGLDTSGCFARRSAGGVDAAGGYSIFDRIMFVICREDVIS